MESEILVVGEALIDVVRRAGAEEEAYPGGSPLNVAIGLGRLGQEPTLATWYGRDEWAAMIESHCARSNVRILPGSDQAPFTTTASALIDEQGSATYTFHADFHIAPLPQRHWRIIHTGSLAALIEPGASEILGFIEAMKGRAFISFDPNCRPAAMGDHDLVRPLVERYVAASDLVKVSNEDLAWIYPNQDTEEAWLDQARCWVGLGPSVVVVTMGAQGAWAVTADTCLRVLADSSILLQDTVGAGDSFMSGLLHGVLTSNATDLAALADPVTLAPILTLAARISDITVSRRGADPPWLFELHLGAGESP